MSSQETNQNCLSGRRRPDRKTWDAMKQEK